MLYKLLAATLFMVGLLCPTLIAQSPNFHQYVEPTNTEDSDNNTDPNTKAYAILKAMPPIVTTSVTADLQFLSLHEDGSTSVVAFDTEGNVALAVMQQGPEPAINLTATWVTTNGTTVTVSVPITSNTPEGIRRATNLFDELYASRQAKYPPRPVTPAPPNDEPGPEALLYFPTEWNGLHATPEKSSISSPPRWHKPNQKWSAPSQGQGGPGAPTLEPVGKWA